MVSKFRAWLRRNLCRKHSPTCGCQRGQLSSSETPISSRMASSSMASAPLTSIMPDQATSSSDLSSSSATETYYYRLTNVEPGARTPFPRVDIAMRRAERRLKNMYGHEGLDLEPLLDAMRIACITMAGEAESAYGYPVSPSHRLAGSVSEIYDAVDDAIAATATSPVIPDEVYLDVTGVLSRALVYVTYPTSSPEVYAFSPAVFTVLVETAYDVAEYVGEMLSEMYGTEVYVESDEIDEGGCGLEESV